MSISYFTSSLLVFSLCFVSISSYSQEEIYGNLLDCPIIDMTNKNTRGQSFLNLIQKEIKPELDSFAVNGYPIVDGERLVQVLEMVDSKVKRQVLRSLKGNSKAEKLKNLQKIGDKLSLKTTNLHNLPNLLAKTKLVKDRFTLSTYVGLASCGGSSLKLADDNYAYNIHYGTGELKTDKLTGRSFGASRIFHATDSSYTHYLKTLQNYIEKDPTNVKHFMKTVMETLTNSEPRRYDKVNDHGDAVLTDFFAIWTAEQTRNIMDGRVDLHWDAALLQVTLLSAFHAGQDKIKLFYKDPLTGKTNFTDTTYELAWPRRNHTEQTCDVDLESRKTKPASLKDYIGVHYAVYKHCGRSGINMSKREWKKLSQEITSFLMSTSEGRRKIENVRKYIRGVVDTTKNDRGRRYRKGKEDIFRELARYLINDKTPKKIKKWYPLSRNTASLLDFVRKNAKEITATIEQKYNK